MRFKPDYDEAAQRVGAWWNNEVLDRPAILIRASRDRADKPFDAPEAADLDDYWTNPNVVIPTLANQLASTWFGGESFPVMYPVRTGLVSITCKYLGAKNVYIDDRTTWSEPFIDDLSEREPIEVDETNTWWQASLRLMRTAASFIKDHGLECAMGLPDLNGPTEVLSGIRGSEELALDFYDCPDQVDVALREVQDAWFFYWQKASEIARSVGPSFTWMGIRSDEPQSDLQSDVSCLISKPMFDEHFLPFIAEQTERIPRTVYHLDGPCAVQHLDSLLELSHLDAIQWVYGAGAGRAVDWIDLLRRIQDGGKPFQVLCEMDEVETLMRELSPEGMMLIVTDCPSQGEGERILERATGWM